jgi:hypothetical protein
VIFLNLFQNLENFFDDVFFENFELVLKYHNCDETLDVDNLPEKSWNWKDKLEKEKEKVIIKFAESNKETFRKEERVKIVTTLK